MRLSFFLAPMMVLMVQTTSLAKEKDLSTVYCPGSNPHDMDAAHLVFEISGTLDYKTIVRVANEMVEESSDPDIQQVAIVQSIDYAYQDLPILVYDTGKIRTYNSAPEKQLEFVVIRPFDDCVDSELRSYTNRTFVYSRAFKKEEINIAVVRQLLDNDVKVEALTKRGRGWICAVDPTTPDCAVLAP